LSAVVVKHGSDGHDDLKIVRYTFNIYAQSLFGQGGCVGG
jgi:hypothetical protein